MTGRASAAARPTSVRCAIYCRISRDMAGTGLGVERQRKECLELADRLGWTVIEVYIDNDISAYSGRRRPEYERLLVELRAGRILGVITWHLDRLNRSPVELERLIDVLERHRASVQTVTAGFIDLSTASGRAVARTLGAWARYESEHKSERIRAKHRELALAGAVHTPGGKRPFGYELGGKVIKPEEAAILREMMRMLLKDRRSTGDIARWLNAQGITGTQGGQWRSVEVHRMLTMARLAGWRTEPAPSGRRTQPQPFLARGQWPAILTRRQIEDARALLHDDTTRPNSHYRHLLSRTLHCGRCGELLCPGKTNRGKRCWFCCRGPRNRPARCGRLSINAENLEQVLVDLLDEAVQGGIIDRILAVGDPREPFRAAVDEMTAEMNSLRADYQDGRIDKTQWRHRLGQLAKNLARAEANADVAPGERELLRLTRSPGSFRRSWGRSDLGTRRAIIRSLTATITVKPTGGDLMMPVAERLLIDWRPA